MNDEKYNNQKIMCNVTNCLHNCIENSTCRLDKIKVGRKTESTKNDRNDPHMQTTCLSYNYSGDLNKTEITGRD